MSDRSIAICGLPGSGKTTFLAALWHLLCQSDEATKLKLESLRNGNHKHLNEIMARWQATREQIHTPAGSDKLVSMNLKDASGATTRVTFPDLSGESYQHMWEVRECGEELAETLRAGDGILLFAHADEISRPLSVAEVAGQARRLGAAGPIGKPADWHPKLAPTQVKLVDLLQMFRSRELNVRARRLGIMLSAWDRVEVERRDPATYLSDNMPLLHQYLSQGADQWDYRIYGVSAQGGEYEPDIRPGDSLPPDLRSKIEEVRMIPRASSRIKLYSPTLSRDLTEPLAWLME